MKDTRIKKDLRGKWLNNSTSREVVGSNPNWMCLDHKDILLQNKYNFNTLNMLFSKAFVKASSNNLNYNSCS